MKSEKIERKKNVKETKEEREKRDRENSIEECHVKTVKKYVGRKK